MRPGWNTMRHGRDALTGPTGLAPATSGLTDRCSPSLSYGGSVRALGLEPSLFRGKSPVPYQSGVTRVRVGARRARRPVFPGPRGAVPGTMPLQLSRSRCSDWGSAARTPGWSRTSGRRCWRPRRHRDSSAGERWGTDAHDVVRAVCGRSADGCSENAATIGAGRAYRVRYPDGPASPRARGLGRARTRARRRSTGLCPGAVSRR